MEVVDLFAGCGGFSLGFAQAGYHVRTAVEIDPNIAAAYQKNHPGTEMIVDDIRNVDRSGVFREGDSDIVVGGPPCQGFSMVGARIRAGFVDDPRNYLFRHFAHIVSSIRPRAFIMENVKGLCSFQNGAVLREIMEWFSTPASQGGQPYYIYPRLVHAMDLGIPQKRDRIFLIGTREPVVDMDALWAWTRAELLWEDPHYFDMVTVRDAIGNLPPAVQRGSVPNPVPQTDYQRYLATASPKLHDHIQSRHSPLAVARMRRVACGQDAVVLDEAIGSFYGGAYGRLCWDRPAPTITTRFDTPAAGIFTHPAYDRTLTPREAARIQGFPDDYIFCGTKTCVCKQIGNAVPPKISYFLARLVRNALDQTG